MIDAIPTWAGGEPAGTPERPAAAHEYPPVNDRPPPRESQLITEQEQTRIEQELAAARADQAAKAEQVRKGREEMLANSPGTSNAKPADQAAQQKNRPATPSN